MSPALNKNITLKNSTTVYSSYLRKNNKGAIRPMTFILPQDGNLDTSRVSQLFSNTVATYKYYWFLSIMHLLCEGKREFSFWEIIAGMVAESWYPIHFFKLSFGSSDSLYERSMYLQSFLDIPIDAKKAQIRSAILNNLDRPEVRRSLKIFTNNVPYWFLSPWIKEKNIKDVEVQSILLGEYCPYSIKGLTISVHETWAHYIVSNAAILRDFCFWNLVSFIQKRNPNVPDVAAKLVKPISRNSLTNQHKYWDRYIQAGGKMKCIYTGAELHIKEYDLDHFIPWSFVTHDLLWNLIPANPSINSSKSNRLPELDRFLEPLAQAQHNALSYTLHNNPSEKILEDFLVFRCSLDELSTMPHDTFLDLFKKQFTPMVQTANNMGFDYWTDM